MSGWLPPGRSPNDDSINASTENLNNGDEVYTAGYEMNSATSVGKPDDKNYDSRLQKINEGRHQTDGELSVYESKRDKKRIAQALCSALPITKLQQRTVVRLIEQLNLDRFGQQKAIERVTLGVIAVVVTEDRVEKNPEATWISWEDEFQDLMKQHDVSMSDLSTIKEIVRDEANKDTRQVSEQKPRRDPNLPGPSTRESLSIDGWDDLSEEFWESLGDDWSRISVGIRHTIPDQYREKILEKQSNKKRKCPTDWRVHK